jgi:hypothetical protein
MVELIFAIAMLTILALVLAPIAAAVAWVVWLVVWLVRRRRDAELVAQITGKR